MHEQTRTAETESSGSMAVDEDGTVRLPPTGGEREDPPGPDVDEDTVIARTDSDDPGDER